MSLRSIEDNNLIRRDKECIERIISDNLHRATFNLLLQIR